MTNKKPVLTPTIKIALIAGAIVFTCIGGMSLNMILSDDSGRTSNTSTVDPVPLNAEPETRFGLTLQERQEFYRRWVRAEDAAFDYRTGEINEQQQAQAKADLLSEYGLTEQQALDIGVEAFEENWPLPAVR